LGGRRIDPATIEKVLDITPAEPLDATDGVIGEITSASQAINRHFSNLKQTRELLRSQE
jgi:hypothetical protein